MRVNSENQEASPVLDKLKWVVALVLLVGMIWGNFYFSEPNPIYLASPLVRIIAMIVIAILALVLVLTTARGKATLSFARESRTELRKVVWPTRKEAMQTTLLIAVITVIASLFLWGLDSLIIRLISFVTMLGH
ncbi:preprotein translocase subunit SecE [Zophobihabitans entericus]|uniref:Protein translocase subunit SecE n=1 Tax=Zophobihabitans entericus TaxID=1635327 RepID=A0A6G9IAS4_9GAMM|nr:preprotein translocase subunit SecE [Zophobihabitans entericus]QIQ20824.1 preprotein translocase subunit SecE [Zophobihabitans entericus]